MDKLTKLLAHCKCGVRLEVNEHRNMYESAEEALYELKAQGEEISDDVCARIIETDTLISLICYPDTPIGFYHILHYDLDTALDEALKVISPPPSSPPSPPPPH
jgi:hypothetical protein